MIRQVCFGKEWIDNSRKDLKITDPGLLEKCMHALELLGYLQEFSKFDFVFKGGTSMILLLPTPRRLSIDIDISSPAAAKVYEPVLSRIGSTKPFVRFEESKRGNDRLPKRRHFKFYYESVVTKLPSFVLLDILEEKNHFPETESIPIQTSFIEVDQDIEVCVPTIDCLIGDKLTAFAPKTVGIRLTKSSSMQVIKQVFDIGELFDHVKSIQMVKKSYEVNFTAENGYRGNQYTLQQSLDDTINTAELICQLMLKGGIPNEQSTLIQGGIKRIESHLIGTSYRLDEARISAAKSAYLAALLKQDKVPHSLADLRFNRTQMADLKDAKILKRPVLDRLKGIAPEAFYYWKEMESIIANARQL